MQYFYCPNIDQLTLDKDESRHCSKVLRLKEGEVIALIDGHGTYAEASLMKVNDKQTRFEVLQKYENHDPLDYKLHIAIAPTKNIGRFEWFVEKATEIGITEITPIITENSERKIVKNERLEKIIVSACKQSKKALFPKLNDLISFSHFLDKDFSHDAKKMIAHCMEGGKMKLDEAGKLNVVVLCIGPEGDFSIDEIEHANNSGYLGVTLGKNRLRTETAAVFACSAINLFNQSNVF